MRGKLIIGTFLSTIIVLILAINQPTLASPIINGIGNVDIKLSNQPVQFENAIPSEYAYAVLNKSGCVERHGNIQLRMDFYLTPDAARYNETYIQVPDIPPDAKPPEDEALVDDWIKSFPLKWQLNPFHSHFIYVSPVTTVEHIKDIMTYHTNNFYEAWQNFQTMRSGWDTATRIRPERYNEILSPLTYELWKQDCEDRIKQLPDIQTELGSSKTGQTFPATEIDVGSAATDRGSYYYIGGRTIIDYNNPANDTGSIDTVECWFTLANAGNTIRAGTFVDDGGGNFTCNDGETLGEVSAGSKLTFSGLDIDISSGEYVGVDCDVVLVRIERDTSGYSGAYRATGAYCDPTDSASYSLLSGDAISLYGTGETAGAEPNISNSPTTYGFGTVSTSSTTNTGLTYFTVTNSSGFAVDIAISGTDMTGGTTWTLSDTATAGSNIYGLKAGLDGGSYNIIVKKNSPFNNLVSSLADSGTQDWGLQLLAPTSFSDGTAKSGTVTLSATAS